MAFLLRARFNSSGPTNPDILNLGGVSFDHDSKLFDGDKCAFFEPSNDNSALQIIGSTKNAISNYIGTDNAEYTIYFKFCINLDGRLSTEPIPILSYFNISTGNPMEWINIEGNDHFAFHIDDETTYQSRKCAWVFDNYWHTFTLCKNKHTAELFLDGLNFCTLTMPETIPIKNTLAIYIGRGSEPGMVDHFYTLESGMLDDICIVDDVIYTEHFIPPNKYFQGADIITNYHWSKEIDYAYMPRDLLEYTDKRMLSTVFQINETQKHWLPRRLRIQWHEEEYLWESAKYWKVSKSRTYTAISFWGLEQPLLMDPWNEENVDLFNCFYAWEEGKLYPFMLFIDRKFVKLSDIHIMKSGQYYTMFIKDRKPDKYDKPIESVEMVYIPFKCIYEEDEPKRMDIEPLYCFNKDGKFDPYYATVYYYLDKEHSPEINCCPIRDEDIPPRLLDDDGDLDESRILHSYWRYGKFEKVSQTSTDVTMRFICSDNQYQAEPGGKVNLYRNKINMPEETYDIIGTDLFRFYYFDPYGNDGFFNKTISMQVVTELKTEYTPPVLTGLISMKEETVYATEPHQCVFKIPEVVDDDGFIYNNFLVFRNSVCMNALGRFRVSYNKKYITFINPLEEIEAGDAITFVFLKTIMADQFGPLNVKPVYLHTSIGADGVPISATNTTDQIVIPPYRKVKYSNDNVMMFIDGTLVIPDRYTIVDNVVHMKMSPVGNDFYVGHEVTFVLLTLASEIEGPVTARGAVIRYQLKQGARFVLYDLMIDKRVKITLDNFVLFDRNGEYMPSFTGEVYNLNIIKYLKSTIDPYKYIPRYLTCVYSEKRNLPNEANICRPDNTLFLKTYVTLYQEFYELDIDFDLFMRNFSFRYNRNRHFGENLQRAFLYLVSYNQLEFLDYYKKHSKMQRLELDVNNLNDRISSSGIMAPVCMDRSLYKDPAHRSFSIFFENGKIPKWYEGITYELNQMYLRFPKLFDPSDSVEVFKFHDLNNTLLPMEAKIENVTVSST